MRPRRSHAGTPPGDGEVPAKGQGPGTFQGLEAAGCSQPDGITYYVREDSTDECWVWGHDPGYYAPFGCNAY